MNKYVLFKGKKEAIQQEMGLIRLMDGPVELQVSASDMYANWSLWQKQERKRRPLGFWSHKLPDPGVRYTPFERQLLACYWALLETEQLTLNHTVLIRPRIPIMSWVNSNPKSHRIGGAQESSILKWKWYVDDRAKPGQTGVSVLHEQVADGPEKGEDMVILTPMQDSPVKCGKPYNELTDQEKGQNITGLQGVVTDNPRPLTLLNSTEIHNRSTYGTIIPWVRKPQHLDRHVIPIPHTCTPVANTVTHTTVFWTILFPPISKCRNKRAWYDTLLRGTGTGLGVLNTIDKQITANKLSKVGRYSHDALQKIGRWIPSGIYSQKYQAYWDVVSARILKHSINDFRWNNVKEWLNWTECNLNMLSAKMQLHNVQQTVMSSNYHAWRELWKID